MNTTNCSSSRPLVPDITFTAATPLSATSAAFKVCAAMAEQEVQNPERLQVPKYERRRTSSHTASKRRERSEPLKRSASSPMLAVAGKVPRIIKPVKTAELRNKSSPSDVTDRFAAKAPWSSKGTGPAKLDLSFWRMNSASPKKSASNLPNLNSGRLRDEEPKPGYGTLNSIAKGWQHEIPTVLVDIQPGTGLSDQDRKTRFATSKSSMQSGDTGREHSEASEI
ncbi:hypothetical protein CPB86DRAFT_813547 [Serendipita vermifera]|nr:hypothetical protein CPB86DRAFT_813547 [Serendipita vermifera]